MAPARRQTHDAVLLSPIVDFTLSGKGLVTNGQRDPMFTLAALIALRRLYAEPEQFLHASASPLYADYSGLPPLLFQVGGIEVRCDDAVRAAEQAHAGGVPVELEIW